MKRQSRGTCTYCDGSYSKGGMIRHLRSCAERKAAIDAAGASARRAEALVHVRVQDRWNGAYWLDLELRGSATMIDLDRYLRAIWLECCGHLSRFSTGGWGSEEIPWARKASVVFRPGVELTHIYDFGTSSETLVRFADSRKGAPLTRHPVALMARNLPPDERCTECGEPASLLCLECLFEDDVWGTLCDLHAEDHPHEEYGEPVPIVNSPRLGLCGYTGPAEPPY